MARARTCNSLASFLPPSTTLRAYQRRMMSTTVAEIGAVYCSVVSFANTQNTYEMDKGAIVQSLIAIRLKLKRSLVLRTNIVYEVRQSSTVFVCSSFCLFFWDVFFFGLALNGTEFFHHLQFSLRGKWPAQRYQKILEIQLYVTSFFHMYTYPSHFTLLSKSSLLLLWFFSFFLYASRNTPPFFFSSSLDKRRTFFRI